jgi:hypothetical protein
MIDHKISKKITKVLVDLMIPSDSKYKMPKASTVINIDFFYNKIKKNKNIIDEINKIIVKNNFKINTNLNKFSDVIFANKELQNYISESLLDYYFSSIIIDKILKKKSNTISFGTKKDQSIEMSLLKKMNFKN